MGRNLTALPTLKPALTLLAFAAPVCVYAQAAPPPPDSGAPLPPFTLAYPNGSARLETGKGADGKSTLRVRIDGGPTVTWGDVWLRADQLLYAPGEAGAMVSAEASGHVDLKRGDEEMRGDAFTFDAAQGLFTVTNGSIWSPPLFVRGAAITRSPSEIRATDAVLGFGTSAQSGGGGELSIRAGEVRIVPNPGAGDPDSQRQTLRLSNASAYLYHTRLLTVKRLTLQIDPNNRDRNLQNRNEIPVAFHTSQISGVLAGIAWPFVIGPEARATAGVYYSTRQGIQSEFNLQKRLIGPRPGPPARRGLAAAKPGAVDPSLAGESPLRQALKARPLPPPPDPVLDYDDISATPDPLANPLHAADRDLHVELNTAFNREYGIKRQGPLLLSRLPEARLVGQEPLSAPAPTGDNEAARKALRQFRLYIADVTSAGRYDEVRLNDSKEHVRDNRFGETVSLACRPLLLGSRVLVQASTGLNTFTYNDNRHYEYLESSVAAGYIFGYRTSLGAEYIGRDVGGATPFYWDMADTQSELQLRGQLGLGPLAKYTVAGLARYDLAQRQIFDYEVTVAVRGQNIEPRLTYRRLNHQLGIGFALPGISF